jgi:hypothetical protein
MAILNDRALLVRHIIRRKAFRKFDDEISQEVARLHGSDPAKSGRYNKILIAKEYLAKVSSAATRAYTHHIKHTLPWEDEGSRILPADHYFAYMAEQRKIKAEFDTAVAEFVALYPEMVEEAKQRLNGMFRADDYPDQQDLARAFEIKLVVNPIPAKQDFRVQLEAGERKELQQELERRMAEVTENAVNDLWDRLAESVSLMRDRLTQYQASPDEKRRFFASWVENVREIAGLIPALNFTNDPRLEAVVQRIEGELCKFGAEDLKVIESSRVEAIQTADDILEAMAGYLGS